jgi:hypothetical protein
MKTQIAPARITSWSFLLADVAENIVPLLCRYELQNGIVVHAFDQIFQMILVGPSDDDAIVLIVQPGARHNRLVSSDHDVANRLAP